MVFSGGPFPVALKGPWRLKGLFGANRFGVLFGWFASEIEGDSTGLDGWFQGHLPGNPIYFFPKGNLLWMNEILHHLRNPGMMIPLQLPTNKKWFQPWFQSGAISGFRNHPQYGPVKLFGQWPGGDFGGGRCQLAPVPLPGLRPGRGAAGGRRPKRPAPWLGVRPLLVSSIRGECEMEAREKREVQLAFFLL